MRSASPKAPHRKYAGRLIPHEGTPTSRTASARATPAPHLRLKRALTNRKGAGLPVRWVTTDEVEHYLSRMAPFAGLDMRASSAWTRSRLGWEPNNPDLLTDLATMNYWALSEA